MAAIDWAEEVANQATTPQVGRVQASEATSRRFSEAMATAVPVPGDNANQVAPQQAEAASSVLPSKPATPADLNNDPAADAQERARRALDLDSVHSAQPHSAHGDTILNGLEKIRGVFNAQGARLNSLASSTLFNINTLMRLQVEVTEFTLLTTVAGKLTGNSTQTLETLLKGQ